MIRYSYRPNAHYDIDLPKGVKPVDTEEIWRVKVLCAAIFLISVFECVALIILLNRIIPKADAPPAVAAAPSIAEEQHLDVPSTMGVHYVVASNVGHLYGKQVIFLSSGTLGIAHPGETLLLTSQVDPTENGVWVPTLGAWKRVINFYDLGAVVDLNEGKKWRLNGTDNWEVAP
jgi:hypothetical protein